MLTDDQLADRIGPRLRRELADIAAPDDLPARLRRRRARQTRRSFAAGAAATAVVAGAATLAVTAGGPASPPAPIRTTLTAWTVTRQPDGAVEVTVRDARDPAGLQRRLRADGIPANVTLGDGLSPSCKLVDSNEAIASIGVRSTDKGTVFTIRPSDIPRGQGLALTFGSFVMPSRNGSHGHRFVEVGYNFVQLSQQCTGSAHDRAPSPAGRPLRRNAEPASTWQIFRLPTPPAR